MRDSFIKIAAGTPEVRVGDCRYNTRRIVEMIREAAKEGARLLVLPELAVTAYTCGDLFLQSALRSAAYESLKEIARATCGLNMLVAVGVPLVNNGKLYNCAAVCLDGEILGVVPKTHLPNYGEFYERRQFTPAPAQNGTIRIGGKEIPFGNRLVFCCENLPMLKIGVEICEDVWSVFPPSLYHAAAGATVLLNLSASNEAVGKDDYRRTQVCTHSAKTVSCYAYSDAGQGESTSDLVFSGHSFICENGTVLKESVKYQNGLIFSEADVEKLTYERERITGFPRECPEGYELVGFRLELSDTRLTRPVSRHPFVPPEGLERERRCSDILDMQANALARRLEHIGAPTAVIGVSGGLDSTLALLVSVRAMDLLGRSRREIKAVTMPCFGTTARTKTNAQRLCELLETDVRVIDIKASVDQHFRDIGFDPECHDVTYENAQARERTQVLMDLANMTGGIVIGTGDLSELALGWATYNGDHMSMYGVNASIPKTLVRCLVQFESGRIGGEIGAVLEDILDTPVSPELLPSRDGEIGQKTEELVGPYELHDFFLYYAVRWGFSPRKIYRLAREAFGGTYQPRTLLKWLENFYRRFFTQQFKRSCLPEGPKIGSVSLSPRGDWRMPGDACPDVWLKELEQLKREKNPDKKEHQY